MVTLKYGGHVGGISHMSAHTPHGIEVCLKTLVVYIIKLHIFSNFLEWKYTSNSSGKFSTRAT